MPDTTKKSVSIKLPGELLGALKDEQHAQRKAGNPEPTYSDLLMVAWHKYSDLGDHAPSAPRSYGRNQRWHDLLDEVLACGRPKIVTAIQTNLEAFALIGGHGESGEDATAGDGHSGVRTADLDRGADETARIESEALERARQSRRSGKRNKPGAG